MDAVVGLYLGNGLVQVAEHLAVQRVQRLRAVDERRPRRDFEENTPSRSAGAVVFISRAAGPSRIIFVKIVHILIKTPCKAVEKASKTR